MKENEKEKAKKLSVKFPETLVGGVYSNSMSITHTKDEFILDFYMMAPPQGVVVARIITSPGHIKRVSNALNGNITKYESKYGPIQETEEPGGKVLN